MENSNNLKEKEEENGRISENEKINSDNDQLGENTEVTPLGEALEHDQEEKEEEENLENDGKAATDPAPDDDPQLDIETISP